ncbi:MAG: hypothetical protein AABX02_05000, partial [archaeon]
MPASISHSLLSPPKKAVVFSLEDVLIPGPNDGTVDAKQVQSLLKSLQSYAKKNKLLVFVISGYTRLVCDEKLG